MPEDRDEVVAPSGLEAIDVNDMDLPEGLEKEIDAAADAYEVPRPPDKGNYPLKLFLGRNGYQKGLMDENDEDSVYYVAPLECRIADGEFVGRYVFPRVDTRVWPGRDTSTMATLCNKILAKSGKKLEGKITAKKQLQVLANLLKREPIAYADIDWQVYSRALKENVYTGMESFPQGEDGAYQHIVKDRRGNRCVARLYVVRWTDVPGKAAPPEKAKPRARRQAVDVDEGNLGVGLDDLDLS